MPIYLVERLFHSISDVVIHWYIEGFRLFAGTTISVLKHLDKSFAVRISLINIFNPLYQDRSFLGYFLGFFMRLFKVVVGSAVYAAIIVCVAAIYIAWALAPLYISLNIIGIDARNIF